MKQNDRTALIRNILQLLLMYIWNDLYPYDYDSF